MNGAKFNTAIFDVDGTLVNGNCTLIFLEYLFKKNCIEDNGLKEVLSLLKKQSRSSDYLPKMATAGFDILAGFSHSTLKQFWKDCIRQNVNYNKPVIAEIEEFKVKGIDIYLFSGSFEPLVKGIAADLNIPLDHAIGSTIRSSANDKSKNGRYELCMGKGKEVAISSLLKERNLDIKQAFYYTDNLSDLDISERAGKAFWLGSSTDFHSHSMAEKGIEMLEPIEELTAEALPFTETLELYYQEKKQTIESSMNLLFPKKWNEEMLDQVIGKRHANWDFQTLEKTYINPINVYLEEQKNPILSLGCCIFLEILGEKPNEFKPFLSINELMRVSVEMFSDIVHWTTSESVWQSERTPLEMSILGNASVSLLYLPLHRVIQNKTVLTQKQKLKLYELYASLIEQSLFGNGMKFDWESQQTCNVSLEEYFDVARLRNKSIIQFGAELALILSQKDDDKNLSSALLALSEHVAILSQLEKDLEAFHFWQLNLLAVKKNPFNIKSNLIGIYSCWITKDSKYFAENLSKQEFLNRIERTDADSYLAKKKTHFKNKIEREIQNLPIKETNKSLLKLYINHLVKSRL